MTCPCRSMKEGMRFRVAAGQSKGIVLPSVVVLRPGGANAGQARRPVPAVKPSFLVGDDSPSAAPAGLRLRFADDLPHFGKDRSSRGCAPPHRGNMQSRAEAFG